MSKVDYLRELFKFNDQNTAQNCKSGTKFERDLKIIMIWTVNLISNQPTDRPTDALFLRNVFCAPITSQVTHVKERKFVINTNIADIKE